VNILPVFKADQLKGISTKILRAAGASESEAETVAQFLVGANLAGHDSHGVIRISQYVKRMKDGMMRLGAPFTIVRENPATALVDGNWGFGQVVGVKSMNLAVAKAKECGAGVVGVFNCNHVGRLADYSLIASSQMMIGLTIVNASPEVAAWGGRSKVLGTNPICVSIPTRGSPILLDMATSVVAEGKVRVRLP
jgi:LDH2 family malate/lactate/ureidoglycolate dehydrogenase